MNRICDSLPFRQPWARAIWYLMVIPLFPEYLAPVWAILAFIAACRSSAQDKQPIRIGFVGKALLIYTLYHIITLPFAEMPLESLSTITLWLLMFLVYFTLTTVLTDATRRNTLLLVFTLVAGIVGVIGCLQYLIRICGVPIPLQLWEPLDTWVYSLFPININIYISSLRVSSTFSSPNIVSQYLVMAVPFVSHVAIYYHETKWRRIAQGCMIALVGCIAFTFSRGAYLALLVMSLILIITHIRHIISKILLGFGALLLIPTPIHDRLLSIVQLDYSILERFDAWKVCLDLFNKKPLFGYGHGIFYTWNQMVANEVNAPHAHNLAIQLLVEGGIVGLILALYIGFCMAQSAFMLLKFKTSRGYGVTIITFLAGLMTHGLVEYGFGFPKLSAILFLVAALIDVISNQRIATPLIPLQKPKK